MGCPESLNGECDSFSAILTLALNVTDAPVIVSFYESSDDDVQFFVDGELVHTNSCNNWSDGYCEEAEFDVYLEVGPHDFELYFQEFGGGAYISLTWEWNNA